MSDPSLFRYRVTFVKSGRLALLSHLELTHALEREIRRAQLPFALTQGFSPHMKIGFGAALPVGVGSTCEIFDLFLTEHVAAHKVLKALQDSSAENLRPFEVKEIVPSEPAASNCYPFSTYEAQVLLKEWNEAVLSLQVPSLIELQREEKTKTYQVADYLAAGLQAALTIEGVLRLRFALKATQQGSLRPDLFLTKLLEENNIAGQVLEVTRIQQARTAQEIELGAR